MKLTKKQHKALEKIFDHRIDSVRVSPQYGDEDGFIEFRINMGDGSAWAEGRHLDEFLKYTGCSFFSVGKCGDDDEPGIYVAGYGVTETSVKNWGKK